ncbi:ABC transporter ATP-binding protein [Qipengyuania qiaonensis]|uniref:ABC transporter ATP-binding protein n=1 Tax=Qipengyuania qiaonensis TaxID=2867240 RepID=A0ABS7JCU0_9SPHN|nr:ABC transporter ATP-binding protein [Qipengyuania qiaonensis]MBX7483644.1 ABC transporter ATP-binding protein [Qipengyuania qiaonensis]
MGGHVSAEGLGKLFRRYDPHRPRSLRRLLTQPPRLPRRAERFWALRDIGFSVASGEMLGIVGRNGSGKSTLLRLLGKVLRPDAGTLHTSGRIGGLLDLNVGMHDELSGRDNVLIGSVIAGLTKREAERRMDAIVAFGQLEDYIDAPVRTYSSGMRLRLGFSTAIHAAPDVLLIDEVLSVGDMAFQAQCYERIRELRAKGMAIILVTHDMSQVEQLCDRALWLDGGSTVVDGTPEVVIGEYEARMQARTRDKTPQALPDRQLPGGIELRAGENRFGSQELAIARVSIQDANGAERSVFQVGEAITVHIEMQGEGKESPIVSLALSPMQDDGEPAILDINTKMDEVALPRERLRNVRLELDRLDLSPGEYAVSIGLHDQNWDYAYDYHWRAYPIKIEGAAKTSAVLNPPRRWVLD